MKKTAPLAQQVKAFEQAVIRRALIAYRNNPMQAAAALGIHVATLNRKMAK